MKLKRLPEDFLVEERLLIPLTDPRALPTSDLDCDDSQAQGVSSGSESSLGQTSSDQPIARGEFVLYRLTKIGLGTPEALEAIRRRWNLPRASLSVGGLKDRHARTIQYLTIRRGPWRRLRQSRLELVPVGTMSRPYGPRDFAGNRFSLVLRDLDRDALERAKRGLESLERDGLPNYFDDQRFGSVGFTGEFQAASWLKGDHARALWLAIAQANPLDRPHARHEKELLRAHWGDWLAAKAALPRGHTRSLVTYLVDHPEDFRGAFARLRYDDRSIAFSAFQSHIWNLALASWIRHHLPETRRLEIPFKLGPLPIPHHLDRFHAETLIHLRVPLPSARNPKPVGEWAGHFAQALDPFGLTWDDLRVRHLKDVFLSKGDRPALIRPERVRFESQPDELYPRRSKLILQFDLPRGSYATILVKRITAFVESLERGRSFTFGPPSQPSETRGRDHDELSPPSLPQPRRRRPQPRRKRPGFNPLADDRFTP